MVQGFKDKNKKFIPTEQKKGVKSSSVNSSTKMNSSEIPKSFEGYDVGKRRKVLITEDIKIVTTKNERRALTGISPISGNKVYKYIKS